MPWVEQISLMAPPFPEGQIINDYLTNLPRTEAGCRLEGNCRALLKRTPSLDSMPNGLREFHRVAGYLYDDLEGIARKHLAIEYYCCGLPASKVREQFERVYEVLPGPTRLTRLPVLFGVSEREYLTCRECAQEQLREEGFSYIHRRTGAPFVNVCYQHRCELRPARNQMLLFDQACREQHDSYQLAMSVEFAKRVSDCMETPASISPYRKDAVADALRCAGWVRGSGRLHLSILLSDFAAFFSGAFSDLRLRHLTQTEGYVENALRNLMRESRAVHPVWCILLKWFSDACEIKKALPHLVPLERPADPSCGELRALMQQHGTIARTAAAMSVSVSRVAILCKRYRLHAAWRPKFIDTSLQAAIRAALMDGQSPKQAQVHFRVSLTTVYRILSTMERPVKPGRRAIATRTAVAKEAWLAARSTNPTLSMSELRTELPATWAQLYRQAPRWLRSHSESTRGNQRRGSRALTAGPVLTRFAQVICDVEAFCDTAQELPLRKSLYRVRHILGVTESVFKSARRRLTMTPNGENEADFVTRRIAWASNRVSRAGKRNWALARVARLRQSTVNRVLSGKGGD